MTRNSDDDQDHGDRPQEAEDELQRHLYQSPLTTTLTHHPTAALDHTATAAAAVTAPPTTISGWQPSTYDQELYVPLAETWHYHQNIKNRHGDTIFQLLQEEQIGAIIRDGEPILRMIIGDANRQVVAVIVREARHGMDGYTIYGPRSAAESLFGVAEDNSSDEEGDGCFPNPFGSLLRHHTNNDSQQHPTYSFQYHPQGPREDTENGIALELYPIASVVQGVLGKTYTVTSPDDKQTIRWRAENGQFRKTLLCCPWCIVMGICMWQFEFQDLNIQRQNRRCWWRRFFCDRRRGRGVVAPGGIRSSEEERSSPSRIPPPPPPVLAAETTVLIRDQEIRTVDVAIGTSPLLALCVTYAIDRLTRPLL